MSSYAEYFYEGTEGEYVNPERLKLTLKLTPTTKRANVSVGELINGIAGAGVHPDEVSGVYKVSAFDSSFCVEFKYMDTLEHVTKLPCIRAGNTDFDVMRLDEQVVTLRVHWLPLYYDNLLLTEVFEPFGQVMKCNSLKSAHADCVTFDGVREVYLKTTEVLKQRIPHLVHLASGQSLLVTMRGRPSYCLKCRAVGHTRQKCPKNRVFVAAVVSGGSTSVGDVSDDPPPGPVDSFNPVATPPPAAEAPVAPPAEPSDSTGGSTESHDGDEAAAKGDSGQDEMDQLTDQGLKRHLDSQDSFILPNRPVSRPRLTDESALETSNMFSPIMSADDIMVTRSPDKK